MYDEVFVEHKISGQMTFKYTFYISISAVIYKCEPGALDILYLGLGTRAGDEREHLEV